MIILNNKIYKSKSYKIIRRGYKIMSINKTKQKYIFFGILLSLLMLILPIVIAQETTEDAGTTPDSILYGLDKAFERIGLAFTFGQANKAEKRLNHANERIAELKEMIDKGKPEYADDLVKDYNNKINKANEIAAIAKLLREDKSKLSELIALATAKHLLILDDVREKVPDSAKETIVKAKESSIDNQKKALRVLAEDKPEKAVEIHLETANNILNKAREKAESNEDEEVEEKIEEFEKIADFGNEISQIAKGLGKDTTTVDQLIALATSKHLDVLTEIYEKVPEQAKAAIERAMSKSIKGRETTIEALKEKDALGNIPEDISNSTSDKIPEDVKGRIGISNRP